MAKPNRRYFAARPMTEIGEALVGKLESLRKGDADINRAEIATAIRHYYGKDAGAGITSGVTRAGEAGELAQFRINSARAYAKAYLAIVTGPKVSWRPQARNGDAGVAAATSLAANLMEDFGKRFKLARFHARWVERAIVCSQAYAFDEWDPGAGPALAPMGDQLKREGDIRLHAVMPQDVVVDPDASDYSETRWRFVRLWKNRYDLAKLYTRLADGVEGDRAEERILDASSAGIYNDDRDRSDRRNREDSDLVPLWYFFHDRTPSMPVGREVIFINSDCVLHDSRLIYAESPVHRIAADEMFDTPHGWSSFWDMLGVQEVRDGIQTTLATIVTSLGSPTLALEQGSEIRAEDVVAGFRVIRYPRQGTPPKYLDGAQIPSDALKYEEALDQKQRAIMGLNDVALGQPQGKELNAQAFAVLASMAVQQASPFQAEAVEGLSALGTSMLRTYRRRVSRERELRITGKASRTLYAVQKFSGSDLEAVDGVTVDIGNPLEQTAAGRATVLQNLMAIPNAVTTPEEMLTVLETGRMESATRATRDELLLLKTEYERLQEGIVPPVHHLHNHALHYKENAAVLYSPENLENPAVLQAVETHLAEHYLQLYGVPREGSVDPMTGMMSPGDPMRPIREAFLMGRAPDPTLLPPPPGMPPMGAPPMGGPPAPPELNAGPVGPPEVQMPPNPLTGQTFDNTTGGGVSQPQ